MHKPRGRTNRRFTMSDNTRRSLEASRNGRSKDPRISCDFLERQGRCSQKSGGARRDRTDDLMLAKHALSQLSYGPMSKHAWNVRTERLKAMVGLGGLEPPTSRLSSARSNQLSYKPGTHESLSLLSDKPRGLVRGERETKAAAFRKWPADCRPCVLKRSDKTHQDDEP